MSDTITLSTSEFLAVEVLLGIETRPVVAGRRRELGHPSDRRDRMDVAAELIHGAGKSGEWFRRARPAEGRRVPPMWNLFSRLKADLDRLEPYESLTRDMPWTPLDGAGMAATDASDLVGTWKGVVWSPYMLRVAPGPSRPEQVDGYLVVAPHDDERLSVINYVEHGTSTMVVQRVILAPDRRVLGAIYEATAPGGDDEHTRPTGERCF